MTALRRLTRTLLVLLPAAALLAVALNTWVNPLRVTPTPWSAASLDPHRAIDNRWNRTAKAGLVRSGDWNAALFGSSRVDIALDPRHPSFDGLRCVNLGLNAAAIDENTRMLEYFLEHHDPERVVFAIDAGDLTTATRTRNPTDFALSPLARGGDPIERELRYHLGVSTLAASFETLGRALAGTPADHTPRGFRPDAPFPENQRALMAGLYLSTTYRMVQARKRHDAVNPEKIAMLREAVDACRRHGARVTLLLTPNHALFQLAYRELDDPDPHFARDRAALAAFAAPDVAVWDFLDAHPVNAEPLPPADRPGAHLEHWLDLFHATSEVGDTMLDRIDGAPGDYGTRLDPDTVEARVAEVAAGLDAYAKSYPLDLGFLRETLASYSSP